MFLRNKKAAAENPEVEDSSKMEEVDIPQVPAGRSRRPLGDISNFVSNERGTNPDAKRPAVASTSSIPPIPDASVTDSIQSLATALSATSKLADDSRVYMRRDADNIDIRDIENPLLCTEVVNEMYENFKRIEKEIQVDSNYMSNQPHVNEKMRTILVDWLVS